MIQQIYYLGLLVDCPLQILPRIWKSCPTFKLDIGGSQAPVVSWSRKSDELALKIPSNLSSTIIQMTTISS